MVQQTQDEGLQVQAAQWKCPVRRKQDVDEELEVECEPGAESEQEEQVEVPRW